MSAVLIAASVVRIAVRAEESKGRPEDRDGMIWAAGGKRG